MFNNLRFKIFAIGVACSITGIATATPIVTCANSFTCSASGSCVPTCKSGSCEDFNKYFQGPLDAVSNTTYNFQGISINQTDAICFYSTKRVNVLAMYTAQGPKFIPINSNNWQFAKMGGQSCSSQDPNDCSVTIPLQ